MQGGWWWCATHVHSTHRYTAHTGIQHTQVYTFTHTHHTHSSHTLAYTLITAYTLIIVCTLITAYTLITVYTLITAYTRIIVCTLNILVGLRGSTYASTSSVRDTSTTVSPCRPLCVCVFVVRVCGVCGVCVACMCGVYVDNSMLGCNGQTYGQWSTPPSTTISHSTHAHSLPPTHSLSPPTLSTHNLSPPHPTLHTPGIVG